MLPLNEKEIPKKSFLYEVEQSKFLGDNIFAACFFKKGKFLATASNDNNLRIWDLEFN